MAELSQPRQPHARRSRSAAQRWSRSHPPRAPRSSRTRSAGSPCGSARCRSGCEIDRLGTKRLAGGRQAVTVESVALNDGTLPTFESATESFARGQFMELSEEERLTGKVFEPYPSGVVVGRTDYVTPRRRSRAT